MVQAEAADRLFTHPAFLDVDPGARKALLEALVEERSPAKTVLLTQGQPNDHLTFLIQGSATIERTRSNGVVESLAALHSPSMFGTTSFFTPGAPTFTVRASTDVWLLTLYHPAYDRLRKDHPRAADALAVAVIRVLSDRFNELDRHFSDYVHRHPDDPPRVDEWAGFRARLFEEPAD